MYILLYYMLFNRWLLKIWSIRTWQSFRKEKKINFFNFTLNCTKEVVCTVEVDLKNQFLEKWQLSECNFRREFATRLLIKKQKNARIKILHDSLENVATNFYSNRFDNLSDISRTDFENFIPRKKKKRCF